MNRRRRPLLWGVHYLDIVMYCCGDPKVKTVTGEVFSGGSAYAGDTGTYLRVLAAANRALAARADAVCEVACGLPRYYKGEGAAL